MRLLADTHAYLWWLSDDPKLSSDAREKDLILLENIFEPDGRVVAATVWLPTWILLTTRLDGRSWVLPHPWLKKGRLAAAQPPLRRAVDEATHHDEPAPWG